MTPFYMHRGHQQPTFGLAFTLLPFLQKIVLCNFKGHVVLRFDCHNRHLIRCWHGDEEEWTVDDVLESNFMLFNSLFADHKVTNMSFHVAIIGHA
jgi:hypothetical protein